MNALLAEEVLKQNPFSGDFCNHQNKMYGDFFRAQKKLRKMYHSYACLRKDCLKKASRSNKGKSLLKRLIVKRGRAAYKGIDIYKTNFLRLINNTSGSSPYLRLKYPNMTSFQELVLDMSQQKSKNEQALDSWIGDTVGVLMEAHTLFAIIRNACQKQRKRSLLPEDYTSIEKHRAAGPEETHESEIAFDDCIGAEPEDISRMFSSETTEEAQTKELDGMNFEIIAQHDHTLNCEDDYGQRYLKSSCEASGFCGHDDELSREFDNCLQNHKSTFLHPFLEPEHKMAVSNEENNVAKRNPITLQNVADAYPCTRLCSTEKVMNQIGINSSSFSAECELQDSCNWNGMCKQQSDFFPETPQSVSLQNAIFAKDDACSNRIIYNTQPTGDSTSSTPVFVCSTALRKRDSLQFGEELTALGTNFNVNAVYNKSSPDWNGLKRGITTDDERHGKVEFHQPTPLEGDGNLKQGPKEDFGVKHFFNNSSSRQNGWIRVSQLVRSYFGNDKRFLASAVLGLVVISVIILISTGNMLSFVGLLIDVLVHAVLLSLVVLITMVVFEANDMTSSLQQGCNSFLELARCLLSDNDRSEMDSSSVPSYKDTGNEDVQRRFANKHTTLIPDDDNPVPESCLDQGIHLLTAPGGHLIEGNDTCEVSTMTESVTLSSKPILHASQLSFAETMTEPVDTDCMGTQTDSICDEEGVVINYLSVDYEGDVRREDVSKRNMGSQVNIDVKKINQQTRKVQQRHQRNLRRLQRKFLAIRRSFQRDASDLKRSDQRKGDFLAQLQLTIPALQREKNRLTAEKFIVERQYTDQKKKNQDLVGRIAKLNQQFTILGQNHQPVLPFQWRPQFLNQNYSPNLMRGAQTETHQQQNKGASVANLQPTTQMTLTQPQMPPSIPNKWLSNLQQFQQRHQTQQSKPNQQARLPIFQLFHNPTSSSNNPEEAKRQLQQKQQYQQLQSHKENVSNPQSQTRPASSMVSFQHGDHPAATQLDSATIGRIGQCNEDSTK